LEQADFLKPPVIINAQSTCNNKSSESM